MKDKELKDRIMQDLIVFGTSMHESYIDNGEIKYRYIDPLKIDEDKPKETNIKERIELKDKLKALGVVELDSRIHSKKEKKTDNIMSPQEFYEQEREKGNTEAITSNPDPNYSESFYQNIFQLMEDYASLMSDGYR